MAKEQSENGEQAFSIENPTHFSDSNTENPQKFKNAHSDKPSQFPLPHDSLANNLTQNSFPDVPLNRNNPENMHTQPETDASFNRFKKLNTMSRELFGEDNLKKNSQLSGPFSRMLFSIPVFLLFWLFYYWLKYN
ncbi:MAG: hypothetical protein HQK83_03915 [Fibrobacteria bacterium]|nr:hypothetical protein [Fibrobacteria bacterium]